MIMNNFFANWDLDQLLENIKDMGKSLGRTSMRPVLSLYYVLRSPETPLSDKLLIASALSYLVLPIDLISTRRWPVIGWVDEMAALLNISMKSAYALVKSGQFHYIRAGRMIRVSKISFDKWLHE